MCPSFFQYVKKASQNSPPAMAANYWDRFSPRHVRGEKHSARRECSFPRPAGEGARVEARTCLPQMGNAHLR